MSDICGATGIECIRCNPGGCSSRKRKSDKISDKDLEAILDVYSQHETCQDKLIFDIAIELKTYRDLEKHGVLVKADWAKGRGAE